MPYRLLIGVLYFSRIQQLSLGSPLNIRLEKFLFFLKTYIPPIPAIMIPGYGFRSAMDIFRYQCTDVCRMITCCFAGLLCAGSVCSHGEGLELIYSTFLSLFFALACSISTFSAAVISYFAAIFITCLYYTTDPSLFLSRLLKFSITAKNPNEKWLTDVTEFKYGTGGKVYLCAILDLYGRNIAGFALSQRNNVALVRPNF